MNNPFEHGTTQSMLHGLKFNAMQCPNKPPQGLDVLWRCTSQRYSIVIDADADTFGTSDPELQLHWYGVIRRTPKGAWIYDEQNDKKFVLLTANKKFACNTQSEAVMSFIARKKRQIATLTGRINDARADLNLAMAALNSKR